MIASRRILLASAALALAIGGQAVIAAKPKPAAAAATAEPNPLATAEQTEVIRNALAAIQTDRVKKARAVASYRWKVVLRDEPPEEAWPGFEGMMDDYTFNFALKAANSDANYPKVTHIYSPPHTWQGMSVPGSRWGGDNPDNVYRWIPLDGTAHFRLDGKLARNPPSTVAYVLVTDWNTSGTANMIEQADVKVNPDGTFSISIDPEPANGRPNHIQTLPNAKALFIRDSMGSWDQRANALTIHRLDPPTAAPWTADQIAAKTAEAMIEAHDHVYWVYKLCHSKPNVIPPLERPSSVGGLFTQRGGCGTAQLADDEAMVVTMDPADAPYYSLTVHDNWFITIDYANHVSSLNNGQVTKNADGTVTFVVAPKDPGVHNWLDTAGFHTVPIVPRVQGLKDVAAREPTMVTRVVKVADLKSVLPKETAWVTPAQRQAQVAERQRQIAARMADH